MFHNAKNLCILILQYTQIINNQQKMLIDLQMP